MTPEKIEVRTPIKLVQFVKLASWSESGAEANALVSQGQVSVNGEISTARSQKLNGGELIEATLHTGEEVSAYVISQE
ncbi:RNA-binding S4 domain-containing protein [Actinomycetaceae bacterium TAE3-ERU4]|nr:RNA-binding S4 domain-containing protein [Actinomycetaceae bacterium TAE3-ERU4]